MIIKVLKGLSIKYLVYDNIENNPTLENVTAADAARGFGQILLLE